MVFLWHDCRRFSHFFVTTAAGLPVIYNRKHITPVSLNLATARLVKIIHHLKLYLSGMYFVSFPLNVSYGYFNFIGDRYGDLTG